MIQSLQRRLNSYQLHQGYEEVLSIKAVKKHVIVQHDYDDDVLKIYRDAAVEHVEDLTRRTVHLSEYKVTMPGLCGNQTFRLPPIREINSVTFLDSDGRRRPAPDDSVIITTEGEYGQLNPQCAWPSSATDIELTVIAGYGTHSLDDSGYPMESGTTYGVAAGDILALPLPMRQAMLLLVGHWYANRETVITGSIAGSIPHTVDSLLFKYRNYRI